MLGHSRIMTLKTESVPEMSVDWNNLIWLSTEEDFTKFHSVNCFVMQQYGGCANLYLTVRLTVKNEPTKPDLSNFMDIVN